MSSRVSVDTNMLISAFVNAEQEHMDVVQWIGGRERICWDFADMVRQEYERNIGKTVFFQKWIARLKQRNAIEWCDGRLDRKHVSKLTPLGCHEPTDQAFIAIAYRTDKLLITEDSDMGKGTKGHEEPHCSALRYLADEMGINVMSAEEACEFFGL